jgi:hypothetical protein
MKTRIFLKVLITLSVMVYLNSCEMLGSGKPDNECSSNRWVAHQSGELLVNGSTMWQMSIANLKGAIPNADKNCHAQMTLEFWFKNKELARTTVKPPLSIVFFGGGGFFDPGSVATYITQKLSDSTYYWTAFCDQAAKNAPDNPVDFGVSVSWDPNQLLSLEDVVLSGIIDYKIYKKP